MAANVTIGQLIDKCIKDPNKKPVMLIRPHSEEFVRSVCGILSNTIEQVLTKSTSIGSLQSYPKFRTLLFQTIVANIRQCESRTNDFINRTLQIEESFMWSTSKEFREVLNLHYLPKSTDEEKKQEKSGVFRTTSAVQSVASYKIATDKTSPFQYSYEPDQVREIATKYYITIIERMRDTIVKVVISQIINELVAKLPEQLNCLITPTEGEQLAATSYIVEHSSVAKERQTLKDNITKIENAIKLTTKYD